MSFFRNNADGEGEALLLKAEYEAGRANNG